MALYHKVEMLLFCGTQTSVGEPGRASEMASHLIGNVSGGAIRTVFMLFQFICLMGTSTIGKDVNVMRVPDPEIGRLYILCFTFIRPVIVEWQRYFNGPKAAARAKHNLFFGLYRPVTSSELSRNLSYHTKRLLNIRMTVRLWRDVATWFLDYHSIRFNKYLPLSRSLLAFQSGHSPGMHAQYASDVRLPSGIDFHIFFDTMRLSGAWHRLVDFSHFSQPTLLEAISHILYPRVIGLPSSTSRDPEGSTFVSRIVKVADEVKRQILPDIFRAISRSCENDLGNLLHSVGVAVASPPSQALTQPVTHLMHPSCLRDLRTFLRNDSASFKDPQQALALELIRGKEPSVLVVGPTGKRNTFIDPECAPCDFYFLQGQERLCPFS
jgi:hypothetical protein